jgi:short-subunit dehydrogenase
MKVNGKVIVVTGGGNGIGRQLVLSLLSRGATVAAVDMSEAALQETSQLAGDKSDRLSCYQLNITDRSAVESLPEKIIAKHGAVDGLINNAGIIQPFVPIAELDYPAIERVMNVNFYGTVYMTKSFIPYLVKRSEAHILNISSMGGFLPVPGQSVYGASKAAVKLFTEGLRSELLNTSVKVTVVFPGAVATDITKNSGVKLKPEMNPENSSIKMTTAVKAAQIIIDGMEGNAYRVLVGPDAKFLDFLYRLRPRFAAEFIYKQMKSLLT